MSRLMVCILFTTLFMAAFVIPQADAQTSTAAASTSIAPAKIAWINLDQVLLTCDEGTKVFDEIQKFVETKSTEMEVMRKELDKLKNDLSLGAHILKDEVRAEKEDNIEAKDIALQRFQQDIQKEINARRDKATNALGKKLVPVIEKVAKEKGLNAVQVLSPSRDAWIDPALIITEDVIKAFNQANSFGASKAPAPAKKPQEK
jgi:outer membrane protein